MFIIVTYDVNISSPTGAKRLRKVAKSCVNYGHRVQNSVFECVVTESQFLLLKADISSIIDKENDSVRFYILGANWKKKIETLGKSHTLDVTEDLIV